MSAVPASASAEEEEEAAAADDDDLTGMRNVMITADQKASPRMNRRSSGRSQKSLLFQKFQIKTVDVFNIIYYHRVNLATHFPEIFHP
jgi:hypothetical protein